MKVNILLLNITKGNCQWIELPNENLDAIIDKECEYLIAESNLIDCNEFQNIYELNDIIKSWNRTGITETDIKILSKLLTFEEMCECIEENRHYVVQPYCEWTEYPDTTDIALYLVTKGIINLPFQYDDTMEHYIDWGTVWREAEYNGWSYVFVDNVNYLVHISIS